MHPILFSAGSLRFPTYGALLVIGILGGLYVALRLGRREGLDPAQLLDFSTWLLLVALIGAKVLMVLADWSYYRRFPAEIFSTSTLLAGGVFYGGFIAATLFAAWYIRVRGLPPWKVVDVFAPAIALGQSVGRLGCFAAGCDYGKPAAFGWGVVFKNPVSHEIAGVPLGIRLYPTQVYESLATFLIFAFLLWWYSRKSRDGEVFVLYLGLYALARFFLEFLRGDEDRGFVFDHLLSTSQFVAVLAMVTAVWMALILRRNPRRQQVPEARNADGKGRGRTAGADPRPAKGKGQVSPRAAKQNRN